MDTCTFTSILYQNIFYAYTNTILFEVVLFTRQFFVKGRKDKTKGAACALQSCVSSHPPGGRIPDYSLKGSGGPWPGWSPGTNTGSLLFQTGSRPVSYQD